MRPAAWLEGTTDRRSYRVEGCSFHVERAPGRFELGFVGEGRHADFVCPDAPEPVVLARLLAGLSGLTAVWTTTWRADSEAALCAAEERLLLAAGRCDGHTREVAGNVKVALLLLDQPPGPRVERTISVTGDALSLLAKLPACTITEDRARSRRPFVEARAGAVRLPSSEAWPLFQLTPGGFDEVVREAVRVVGGRVSVSDLLPG